MLRAKLTIAKFQAHNIFVIFKHYFAKQDVNVVHRQKIGIITLLATIQSVL